ncbi:hypothetical protein [Capnocytophaga sputigena]|uniref:hypothetical protein n=1 Tax=Capnocytophaga sputigena TaxID=1019 RepID=UPI0028D08DB5|nr:hypothetical protein [Capnocytophaga sputigena]
MKNTSLKLLVLALVGLFLTNCQRDDAPEVLPQEEPVPTVDPQAVVSLDEAKTLFDATEKQKSMINATSRSKQPLIQLETNWRYFEQMQTLAGDAYAKIPITIIGADWDTECSTEMIFVKKNNVAKQYLFVTEVDSLTNDNRIVNADFYLLTSKGEFISAYRMENGIITNELIPKYKRNYRLVVNAELDRTSRKPKKRNNFTLSMFSNWSTENDSEGDDDCGDGAPWGSGGSGTEQDPFQLNPVTLVGERKNQINNSYTPYPTYTPYTPNNNGFPDPDKLDREMPRGGGGGGGRVNSSSNLAYDMIDADGNKVEDFIINELTNPCAKALLDQAPNLNNDIARLMRNTFGTSDKFNITVSNKYLIGATGSYNGQKNGDVINCDIFLDDNMLKTATQEYILVTLYHEVLHAFFDVERNLLGEEEFKQKYLSVRETYLSIGNGNQERRYLLMNDHSKFNSFIETLAQSILSFNRSFPLEKARALAKEGIVEKYMLSSTEENFINEQKGGNGGSKCP